MAKAEMIEIEIFPMAMVSAMMRLFSIIAPTGSREDFDVPTKIVW